MAAPSCAPAPAPSVETDEPLNLHAEYQLAAACGHHADLLLRSHTVQQVSSRLRGITACSAVLLAGTSLDVNLGEWMQAGLLDAIHALAEDANMALERTEHERTQREGVRT